MVIRAKSAAPIIITPINTFPLNFKMASITIAAGINTNAPRVPEYSITQIKKNIKKATINGVDAEIVDFVAKPENIETFIYYKVAFIESKEKLYMVMAWTLAETKDKYDAEMEKMLNSFSVTK